MGQCLEMEGCLPPQLAHLQSVLSLLHCLWWWFSEHLIYVTGFLHCIDVWLNCRQLKHCWVDEGG